MPLDTWVIYFVSCVGLSLSPGPNGLLALTHGVLHGSRRALFTIFGGALGFVIVIALCMFGIGALIKSSVVWLSVLKWVGVRILSGWVFRYGAPRQWLPRRIGAVWLPAVGRFFDKARWHQ